MMRTGDLRYPLGLLGPARLAALARKAEEAYRAVRDLALELEQADLEANPGCGETPLLEAHFYLIEVLDTGIDTLRTEVGEVQEENRYVGQHAQLVGLLADLQGWVENLPAPPLEGSAYPKLGPVVAALRAAAATTAAGS